MSLASITDAAAIPDHLRIETGLLRVQALKARAVGQNELARELLESALTAHALEGLPPDTEVLSDLAAMALQDGEIDQAITLARQAIEYHPEHAISQFTLAVGLSCRQQNAEALHWYTELTTGQHAELFAQDAPQLARLAHLEWERLRTLTAAS